MRVRELLRRLWPFLLAAAVLLSILTFLAPAAGDPTKGWGWVLSQFDLRQEGNVGTWFGSMLFLVCAVSFAPLAAGGRRGVVGRRWGLFFLLCALAFAFVALDEMTEIHERVGRKIEHKTGFLGDTRIRGHGFTWVLVYGPVGGLAFAGLAVGLGRLALRLPEGHRMRRRALVALIATLVSMPLVLTCEVAEGYLRLSGSSGSGDLLSCLEEVFELGVSLGLVACNTSVAEGHDL